MFHKFLQSARVTVCYRRRYRPPSSEAMREAQQAGECSRQAEVVGAKPGSPVESELSLTLALEDRSSDDADSVADCSTQSLAVLDWELPELRFWLSGAHALQPVGSMRVGCHSGTFGFLGAKEREKREGAKHALGASVEHLTRMSSRAPTDGGTPSAHIVLEQSGPGSAHLRNG
ncbi:hypothetical protein PaG_02000 [Moesziomyces aphidis]|uniref:Uncharacterized protein n=1 Tax=Moesziomyces aphidis TaxID=84754 RepID=W3VQ53_MOEAP|nr:hypothetical protein PaG_02000 [Moesziomyces aphidis]